MKTLRRLLKEENFNQKVTVSQVSLQLQSMMTQIRISIEWMIQFLIAKGVLIPPNHLFQKQIFKQQKLNQVELVNKINKEKTF